MTKERTRPGEGPEVPDVAARLRVAYHSVPDLDAAQLAERVELLKSRLQVASLAEYRTKRGVSTRWWFGAAAAAALVAAFSLRPARFIDRVMEAVGDSNGISEVAAAPYGSTTVVDGGSAVRFVITIPSDAHEVALVGDFNGWDSEATPMERRNGDDTWSAKVPLVPGVHKYAFVVDGSRWLVNPLAPQLPDAGFGPANAVVVGSL